MLTNYLKGFIDKYPKQAHVLAVIVVAGIAIFNESATAHALVLQAVNLVPHGGTIASMLGSLALWYAQNEK